MGFQHRRNRFSEKHRIKKLIALRYKKGFNGLSLRGRSPNVALASVILLALIELNPDAVFDAWSQAEQREAQ